MNAGLISVVFPVFNSEKYLKEALDSLLAQTYTQFEVLAVYDKSKDNSLQILTDYSKADSRIKIINGNNANLISALNVGMAAAQGEFIARFDSDDICTADRFEKQVEFLKNHQADICGGHAFVVDADGKVMDSLLFPISHELMILNLVFGVPFCHGAILFRRSLLDSGKFVYDVNYPGAEDYALWASLSQKSVRFGNVDRALYYYREHAGSITRSKMKSIYSDSYRIMKAQNDFVSANMNVKDLILSSFDKASVAEKKMLLKFLGIRLFAFADFSSLGIFLSLKCSSFFKLEGLLRGLSTFLKYRMSRV